VGGCGCVTTWTGFAVSLPSIDLSQCNLSHLVENFANHNEFGVENMRTYHLRIALAAVVACAGVSMAALAESPTLEKVQLWDKSDGTQGMTVSGDKVKAGTVMFEVTNISDKEDHELLLVKTDLNPEQFPLDDSQTRIDEEKFEGLRELGDLTKGETSTHKVNLTPGRYIMFCNEPGHFNAGMWHVLTVTP
jgi:uncharacterized cupredoxin-like copper-binding protein